MAPPANSESSPSTGACPLVIGRGGARSEAAEAKTIGDLAGGVSSSPGSDLGSFRLGDLYGEQNDWSLKIGAGNRKHNVLVDRGGGKWRRP